ncbi:MaoC family dehydratase N-terminal domain-containing protein [Psychrobacillus sp. NPDC096426]|uniref:FAS1-like dehydratase domain-containing protein n=1 Tax=Psychrobacillus sp. NPDC096426 TaxID=3364491 RepID=UPI00381A03B3
MNLSNTQDLIGVEFKPYSFDIEKGKIRELMNAIGDDNPIYTSIEAAKEAGYDGIPIPLTFLNTIDLWGGYGFEEKAKKLKLNKIKVLNGEQEFEYLGEIYAGDQITVTSKVIHHETKTGSTGKMDLITTENQYRNDQDKLVAISRNVIINRA